jgi:hypothetical protein
MVFCGFALESIEEIPRKYKEKARQQGGPGKNEYSMTSLNIRGKEGILSM